jgi:tRNA (adenine57-N1/adenine58-N1)-methyltransferase
VEEEGERQGTGERQGEPTVKTMKENDLVLVVYKDMKYLKRIIPGNSFNGKGGTIKFADLAGLPFGIRYGEYHLFEATLEDIIMYGVKRETQIVYPKDAFYIAFKLNLSHGTRMLEVGTGSGALTSIFSRMVGPEGRVVTIEREERHLKNARRNIERFALWENVETIHGEVDGYDGGGFDAAFVDVREPWLCLQRVWELMGDSAPLGMIVPTANQISDVLKVLPEYFGDVEVIELFLRKYKTVAERVRPFDRMVAHTGYLIFARKVTSVPDLA